MVARSSSLPLSLSPRASSRVNRPQPIHTVVRIGAQIGMSKELVRNLTVQSPTVLTMNLMGEQFHQKIELLRHVGITSEDIGMTPKVWPAAWQRRDGRDRGRSGAMGRHPQGWPHP